MKFFLWLLFLFLVFVSVAFGKPQDTHECLYWLDRLGEIAWYEKGQQYTLDNVGGEEIPYCRAERLLHEYSFAIRKVQSEIEQDCEDFIL